METFLHTFRNIVCDDVSLLIYTYWERPETAMKELCEAGKIPDIARYIANANLDKKNPAFFSYAVASGNKAIVEKLVTGGFATKADGKKKMNIGNRIKRNPNAEMLGYISSFIEIEKDVMEEIFSKALVSNNHELSLYCLSCCDDVPERVSNTLFGNGHYESLKWLIDNASSRGKKIFPISGEFFQIHHELPDEIVLSLSEKKLASLVLLFNIFRSLVRNSRFELARCLFTRYPALADSTCTCLEAFISGNVESIKFLVEVGVKFREIDPVLFNNQKDKDGKNEYNRQYCSKIKWLKLLPLYEVSKNETHLYF